MHHYHIVITERGGTVPIDRSTYTYGSEHQAKGWILYDNAKSPLPESLERVVQECSLACTQEGRPLDE